MRIFDPKKKAFTLFGHHWYTRHATFVSSDERYVLFLMSLFGRAIGAHLYDRDTSINRCLSAEEALEFVHNHPGKDANAHQTS